MLLRPDPAALRVSTEQFRGLLEDCGLVLTPDVQLGLGMNLVLSVLACLGREERAELVQHLAGQLHQQLPPAPANDCRPRPRAVP